jgi:hypothetical protein
MLGAAVVVVLAGLLLPVLMLLAAVLFDVFVLLWVLLESVHERVWPGVMRVFRPRAGLAPRHL